MNEYKITLEDLLKCQSVIESIAREFGGGELGIDFNGGRWFFTIDFNGGRWFFTFVAGNYITTSAGATFDEAYRAAKLAIEKV